ncbi:MAG TPA: Flp family type IVb pilin [Candidatus Binataceae bacterium]|nr:Flp family type IVb pilin [Candidatus Binataceae bacterium]
MELITKLYVQARERACEFHKGQTMTEYALILSAVAVVVFAGYQTMGNDITSLLTTIDGKL